MMKKYLVSLVTILLCSCQKQYKLPEEHVYQQFFFVKKKVEPTNFGENEIFELNLNRKLTTKEFLKLIEICDLSRYDYKVSLDSSVLINKRHFSDLPELYSLGVWVSSEARKEMND